MGDVGEHLPSGIVTFVFTDIEQSTRLLRHLGDGYGEVLDRHFALLRQAWAERGGHELDTAGDSDFVAFQDAAQAVEACAHAQRLLTEEAWPGPQPLRVRMGVHSGLASPRGDTYVALAVHQAARVMSAAHGGQVLVSGDTAERLPALADVDTVPVGRFRLRDFEDPVPLFGLAGPGLPSGFPAVRAVPADGHNLVAPPTPFIGRRDDVHEIAGLVGAGRVVTLTGHGGVGKTRLATEAGLRVAPAWPDGVWMVDLSTVQEPSQLAAAVGAAVGAPVRGGDRWDDVVEHLRTREALVVLDGCEHLIESCAPAVRRLLAAAPRCGVLATSRVPLSLPNEAVWRVPTLAVPATGAVTAADAAASSAVQLFVDRARSARRDFRLDDTTAPAVAAICARLDGLPLALELAAARLGVLSLQELVDGLDDRFRLLRTRSSGIPARQRTMEALLDWSDRLLEDPERACFRRLGVFGGSFSLHAASAAVAGDDLDAADVPELIWSLVDKSLVVADLTANDTRYRLLESVAAFARRRLDEQAETAATASRLAGWYLERIGPDRPRGRAWVGETGVELANVRAIVPLVAAEEPERAQALAVTVGRYLDASDAYLEGIDQLTRYAREIPQPTPTLVSLLACLGDLHLRTGDLAAAGEALRRAEAVQRQVGAVPEWDDVAVERSAGDLLCRSGDSTAAAAAAREALGRPLSVRGRARMLSQLGIASVVLGDLAAAWDAFGDELAAYEELGYEGFQASAHGNLAEVALRRGDGGAAARHQRACLALGLELGSPVMLAFSMIVAARLTAAHGDWETAAILHGQGEALLESTGLALYADDRRLSDAMLADARNHLGDDDFAKATDWGRSLELPEAAALADQVLAAEALKES